MRRAKLIPRHRLHILRRSTPRARDSLAAGHFRWAKRGSYTTQARIRFRGALIRSQDGERRGKVGGEGDAPVVARQRRAVGKRRPRVQILERATAGRVNKAQESALKALKRNIWEETRYKLKGEGASHRKTCFMVNLQKNRLVTIAHVHSKLEGSHVRRCRYWIGWSVPCSSNQTRTRTKAGGISLRRGPLYTTSGASPRKMQTARWDTVQHGRFQNKFRSWINGNSGSERDLSRTNMPSLTNQVCRE